jgi:hypothetical protein
MTFDPSYGSTEPDYTEQLRLFSQRSVKQAWSGLAVSAVLLAVAAVTIHGLRTGNLTDTQQRAYFMIVWLFGVRLLYSLWKLFVTRRDVSRFRRGIERQLELTRISARHTVRAEADINAA